MHAVASLLPVPTCTCGLTFTTAALLQAHITASLSTGGSSSSSTSSGSTTAAPAPDPRQLAAICRTSGCGHPYIAHGDRGPRCRIMLGANGEGTPCTCTAFS